MDQKTRKNVAASLRAAAAKIEAGVDYDLMAKEAEGGGMAKGMVHRVLVHVTSALYELNNAAAVGDRLKGKLSTRDVQAFKAAVMKAADHVKNL